MSTSRPIVACWLDRSMGVADAFLDVKRRFEGISNRIASWRYFDGGDEFQEFINSNPNMELIVIMSGSFAKQHLTPISDRQGLRGVYILCQHIDRYKHLEDDEPIVKGVFLHEGDLYDKLRSDLQREFA